MSQRNYTRANPFAICLQIKAELLVNKVESEMQQLLKVFEDIFQEPEQLPPVGEINNSYHS
jgi:hypothetical protein